MRIVTILVLVALSGALSPATAADNPSADRILPKDQYSSDKARRLAETHGRALQDLNAAIYHCLPWVEVQRQSIGFFKPKGVTQDDRYLSLRVYVEQDPTPQFSRLKPEERASAMYSRYVGPLLRRLAANPALVADGSLDGFTVIVEWLKQTPRGAGERPVHETMAVFIRKALALEFLRGRVPIGQLAERTRTLVWDGETALGEVRPTAWDDNFVATHKVANYQLAPGVTCH